MARPIHPYPPKALQKRLEQSSSVTQVADAICRQSLYAFTERVFKELNPDTEYVDGWHVELICDYLELVYEGKIRRLIINIPPRHLKSTLASVSFTAWILGKQPSKRILAGSYAAELAERDNKNVRTVMQSEWYQRMFPSTRISRDANRGQLFRTSKHGQRMATGIGGQATGHGGTLLIADDPQNPKMALSDAEREKSNLWLDQTLVNRQDDPKKSAIIVIQQRLHADDMTGHIQNKQGGEYDWTLLCLPAEAQGKTVYKKPSGKPFIDGRKEIVLEDGEPLQPKRMGKAELNQMRHDMGDRDYDAQYNQNPVPLGGGIFKRKWFKTRWLEPEKGPHVIRLIQSWDTASKEKEHNDPSVCCTFIQTNQLLFLMHVHVEKMIITKLRKFARSNWEFWKQQLGIHHGVILIEDKNSGTSLIHELSYPDDEKGPLPVVPIEPQTEKIVRAGSASIFCNQGRVVLPANASWLSAFEKELFFFPDTLKKDQVDSFSQGVLYAFGNAANLDGIEAIQRVGVVDSDRVQSVDSGWGVVKTNRRQW